MKKILVVVFCFLLFGCGALHPVSETRSMMGTDITIIVYHTDAKYAAKAIDEAFEEIQIVDMSFSNYINTSQVSTLNKDYKIRNASQSFLYVLQKSNDYSKLSEGAFDPTVQPLLDLYSKTFGEEGRPPTDSEIKEILGLVEYRNINVEGAYVSFKKKGMSITLGGIAKGYAIDQAIERLQELGIKHALVNAGGDMRAIGAKPEGPWAIALQNPRDPNDYLAFIKLDNLSIATSGDYERYYDDSKKSHHIMDPKTGRSATDLISVTIIADKAIDADALATAVFVMGKEGLDLIEETEGVEALIITSDRDILYSKGFTDYEID